MVFSQNSRHCSVPVAAADEQHRGEHKEEQKAPQGHGKQLAEPKHPPPTNIATMKSSAWAPDGRVSLRDAISQGGVGGIRTSISTTGKVYVF